MNLVLSLPLDSLSDSIIAIPTLVRFKSSNASRLTRLSLEFSKVELELGTVRELLTRAVCNQSEN